MAIACKNYLEANGVEVKMSRYVDENDTLNEEAKECNAYKPDLAIDIHNNSGGGDGFEVFCSIYGGTSKILAQNIEKEVLAIGQNSRGVKTREGNRGDYYGFIRMTTCPSVICEGVFVDNINDAIQADELEEQEAFGIAYAKGILKTLNIEISNMAEEKDIEQPKETHENENIDIFHDGKINCIFDIQEYLNNHYGFKLALDNKYGVDTHEKMVKALQIELNNQFNKGLKVDGAFGVKTKEACVSVKQGAKGRITYLIQMMLFIKGYSLGIDGKYGTETKRVVGEFQKANGLSATGSMNKDTFEKLFK